MNVSYAAWAAAADFFARTVPSSGTMCGDTMNISAKMTSR